ncbi:MAG: methionine adenosyltransferase [Planctomycetes bacterium]|nr:methionine adenosyltransferase [Planctomycetota bacterium]
MSCNTARSQHLFTSESVTGGHPDKVSDAVSDAVLDSLIKHDPMVRCACETLVTTGLVVVAGEVTIHTQKAADALADVENTVRQTIKNIGYDDPATGFDYRSCAVIRTLHSQSADINQGVDKKRPTDQGAGDQGIMFGFACDETSMLMPLPIFLAHRLTERLTQARQTGEITWLRPDGKSQVTIEYANGCPLRVHTVVLSTQHTERVVNPKTGNMSDAARNELIRKIIKPAVMQECPGLWNNKIVFHINPTGRFLLGGPHADTGLTGRKIIVDTYGGRGCHGGGAFSGKDPSKVDRSASYMARHIAKNVVKAGLARMCEVQLGYAIGVAEPVSVLIDTDSTARVEEETIERAVRKVFPLRPADIIEHLNLLRPIYLSTVADGHFGRKGRNFTWEHTDHVSALRKACGL